MSKYTEFTKLVDSGIPYSLAANQLGIPRSTAYDWVYKKSIPKKPEYLDQCEDKGLRILVYDIETAPAIHYAWSRFREFASESQVIQNSYVLTWSAKWLGSDYTLHDSIHYHHSETGKPNDEEVCRSLWELLNEADIIIHQNGDKFDLPTMNSRFVRHGLIPPHPSKTIDTLKIAKAVFRFPSNSLDSIASYLGLTERKIKTTFELWRRCMEGDCTAFEEMIEYNCQDVNVLEKVYMKIRAYDRKHPSLAVFSPTSKLQCICGSHNLESTGKFWTTSVSRFETFRCGDCSRVVRSGKNSLTKEDRENLTRGIT